MKTTLILLVTILTGALTSSVIADNIMPPSGPYKSINKPANEDSLQINKQFPQASNDRNQQMNNSRSQPGDAFSNRYSESTPEWVKQQQIEMMNNQQAILENQKLNQAQVPEWVKQQQAQMEQRVQQSNMQAPPGWQNSAPQGWNNPSIPRNYNQLPPMPNPGSDAGHNNQMNKFPSARGPVFGPAAPPAEFYNQPGPGFHAPRNMSPYPPMWR